MDDMVQVADERIRVGTLMGRFAQAFTLVVQEICVQDQKSSTGFLVAIVASMNTYSRKLGSDMRILCQWDEQLGPPVQVPPRYFVYCQVRTAVC